jgi:hypothetical protein
MSEQNTSNCAQLEDTINKILIGDSRQNALNFVQHLASIGMDGDGRVKYKRVTMCDIHICGGSEYPGPWTIWMYWPDIESVPNDERLIEITWAHVHNCHNCLGGNNAWCSSEKKKTIFGRGFDNVCQAAIAFTDPSVEAVECAKKLMEMRKHAIEAEN